MLKSTHRALMAEQMVNHLNDKQAKELYYQDTIKRLEEMKGKTVDLDKVINVLAFVKDTAGVGNRDTHYQVIDMYNNMILELSNVLCKTEEDKSRFVNRLLK